MYVSKQVSMFISILCVCVGFKSCLFNFSLNLSIKLFSFI